MAVHIRRLLIERIGPFLLVTRLNCLRPVSIRAGWSRQEPGYEHGSRIKVVTLQASISPTAHYHVRIYNVLIKPLLYDTSSTFLRYYY
jgi:hypothetical protein